MTISANYPTIRPTLMLDFANSAELDPRITFTRSTTANYYDGKTSVLAEQNLQTYSADFTNATWTKQTVTATISGSVTDPSGGTNGNTITESATTAYHNFYDYPALITGQAITGSIYLKANTRTFALVCLSGPAFGGSSNGAIINLSTGAVGNSFGTYSSIAVSNAGNGWYRVSVTATTSATNNGSLQVILATADSSVFANLSYAGDGTSGIYAWGAQLEQRSAVTAYNATTTTAITNYIPVLQTAASNQARFDHDPVAGTSLGLLIEQQSTNLLLQSQTFNTSWTLTNATLTSAADIAPDSTQTAFKLVDTATAGLQALSQTYTKAASAIAYTASVYFKASQRTYSWLQISDGSGNGAIVYYNLSTGAISTAVAGIGTAFTSLSATINPVGNNWYRCTITGTSNTATSLAVQFGSSLDGSTNSFTGNGYSGLYVWGAQLEALAFSTSYIPTTTAAVTRTADNASMTGTNFSSWFNASQGTYYVEFNALQITQSISILGNSSNICTIYQQASNFSFYDGTNQGSGYIGAISLNTFYKGAISMTPSTNTLSLSGTSGSALTTNGRFLTQSNLQIGYGYNSPQSFVGHFKKIAFYPLALSSTNLQALTGS